MARLAALYYPVVGWWLLAGSVVFLGCAYEPPADKLMRQWTYILAEPYEHGRYGHIFVIWVAVLNIAIGAFIVLAPGWDPAARQAVVIAVNIGYATFLGLAIAELFSPNYGPGMWVCVGLWTTLLAWGLAAMMHPL